MKVAVTSTGSRLSSQVDPHFGRTRYFLLVDAESGSFAVRDNSENLRTPHHAGMQGAGILVSLGVKAVITGQIGPKAFRTLQAGRVSVYAVPPGSVGDAVKKFKAGELQALPEANAKEHSEQTSR
jgi:predicted Fe-Mo cluster-binding NifX family protein